MSANQNDKTTGISIFARHTYLYESKGNFLFSNNLSGIFDRFKGRQYLELTRPLTHVLSVTLFLP